MANLSPAPFSHDIAEARQILGYTTLRSLCKGALKLFVSVFFEDYRGSQEAVYDRKQMLVSPEDITFDSLTALYVKKGGSTFTQFLRRVQQRGNAIHNFFDRAIGTQAELLEEIIESKEFLFAVDDQLPYP